MVDLAHCHGRAVMYGVSAGLRGDIGILLMPIVNHSGQSYGTVSFVIAIMQLAFAVYGIATIAGALLSGLLSNYCDKGKLLGFYYGFRGIWVLLYLFVMPKTFVTAVLFSFGLGMTGDATVSPTSGLMQQIFR
jgi:predicted MFS family arabinose efflux permease